METTPGRGWTIFQRRVDGSVDFYKNWIEYKRGFGNVKGEYWLGLDRIHRLSASGLNVLRVDLETFESEKAHAVYESFSVGDESEYYILHVDKYTGTAYLIFCLLINNHFTHKNSHIYANASYNIVIPLSNLTYVHVFDIIF